MDKIKIVIITPEKKVLEEEIYEVILPTTTGQIAVLPGHLPLITCLTPGVISLRREKNDPDTKLEHLATFGGLAEINGETVRILAENAKRAKDLDEFKIKEAQERALQARKKAQDENATAEALAEIERALAQLKVLELEKRRHQVGK